MQSLDNVSACAAGHLRHDVTLGARRAFHAYDRQGDPAVLDPVDALAPAP